MRSDEASRSEGERGAGALFVAITIAFVLGGAAAFYAPALRRTGVWPAPLDDVYIHFDFARAIATGHPFEWVPGNGYSSGATSVVYPFVLAIGWIVGFRGAWLGVFAALVACASVVDLCLSLREAAGRGRGVAVLFAPLVLCVPLVDWSLFSGMEVALFGAVMGRALVAVRRSSEAPAHLRARAQWRVGGALALLVATRPEAAALAIPLCVACARGAGSLGAAGSLVRAGGPTAVFLAAQAIANRALTGEWSAAGAVRKLLISDPYTTRLDVAIEVLKNLIALRTQAFDASIGGWPASALLPALAIVAMVCRRTRALAIPLGIGTVGTIFLVALNSTARYQNWRYAAPSLLMLLCAAALGIAAIAGWGRRGGIVGIPTIAGCAGESGGAGASAAWRAVGARRALRIPRIGAWQVVAAGLAIVVIVAPRRAFERQIDHFARASANIREQQVEVGRRLAGRSPRPRRVFLSDAGAIPYVSGLPAIDGLGLGGYRDLPFARASVHGNPAVVELLERLPLSDRPDVMAVYPSWWRDVVDTFGRRFDAVRIQDNVICGADEKALYDADFGALAPPDERREGAVFELDTADLVSEREARYAVPAPRGGWVVFAVLALDGRPRFDAGRIVPQGKESRFVIPDGVAPGPATLVLRTDGGPPQTLRVTVERASREIGTLERTLADRPADRWTEVPIPLADVASGDAVRLASVMGAYRDFHLWLVRPR